MRTSFIFIILFATLVFQAHGATDISAYLKTGLNFTENHTDEQVGYGGTEYSIIRDAEGREIFVIEVGAQMRALSEKSEVERILMERERQNLTKNLDEFEALLMNFGWGREPWVRDCKRQLGLDNYPCIDTDSCLYACASVRELCLNYALGAEGFLSDMLAYSQSSTAVEVSLTDLLAEKIAYANGTMDDPPNASKIDFMNEEIVKIASNKLFLTATQGGYEFCYPIPYNTTALAAAKAILLTLASHGNFSERASGIANRTTGALDSMADWRALTKDKLEVIRSYAAAKYATAAQGASDIVKAVSDPMLELKMSQLKDLFEQISVAQDYEAAVELSDRFNATAAQVDSEVGIVKSEFDLLVKMSNDCADRISEARRLAKSPEQVAIAEELRLRKAEFDGRMAPPIKKEDMQTMAVELNAMTMQANSAIGQFSTGIFPAFDTTTIIAAAVIIAIALAAFAYKKGIIRIPVSMKGGGARQAQAASEEGAQAPAQEQSQSSPTQAARAQGQTARAAAGRAEGRASRLVKKGDEYRAMLRTIVRDRAGKPMPDGTPVMFEIDKGEITREAGTKDGKAFAKMVFKKHPGEVKITISAAGLRKKIGLAFK